MVDFNNESTVSTPAVDVVKILILQRRNDFIEALEAYRKEIYRGIHTDNSIVKSRLNSLFLEVSAALKRSLKEEDFEALREKITTDKIEYLEEAFLMLNTWLDDKHIIRVDNKKTYDRRRVENENKSYKV